MTREVLDSLPSGNRLFGRGKVCRRMWEILCPGDLSAEAGGPVIGDPAVVGTLKQRLNWMAGGCLPAP